MVRRGKGFIALKHELYNSGLAKTHKQTIFSKRASAIATEQRANIIAGLYAEKTPLKEREPSID